MSHQAHDIEEGLRESAEEAHQELEARGLEVGPRLVAVPPWEAYIAVCEGPSSRQISESGATHKAVESPDAELM